MSVNAGPKPVNTPLCRLLQDLKASDPAKHHTTKQEMERLGGTLPFDVQCVFDGGPPCPYRS